MNNRSKILLCVGVGMVVVMLGVVPATLRGAELCGDINGNTIVADFADVVLFDHYIGGFIALPEPGNADLDLCGSINIADYALLIAYRKWGDPFQICVAPPECQPATGENEVRLSCPQVVHPDIADSVAIPIHFTCDQQLLGMSLGFHWNSNDLRVTSLDVSGSVIPSGYQVGYLDAHDPQYVWGDGDSNYIMVVVYPGPTKEAALIEPQSDGLLGNLWIRVAPGAPDQTVDIDSAFYAPAGEFIFAPAAGGAITPAYVDCGVSDISILNVCGDDPLTNCTPGDANGDGTRGITDAVVIIQWIFAGGSPPRPYSICSGDPNGDCVANISDAVYLIAWVFAGGPHPVTCAVWEANCSDPGVYNPGPWSL